MNRLSYLLRKMNFGLLPMTLFWVMVSSFSALNAQVKPRDFSLTMPNLKISNSLYKTITFLDSRHDTANLGTIQHGVLNKLMEVQPKSKLSDQLNQFIESIIDSTAKDGQLLFQLRFLKFAELRGGAALQEKGYCLIRAALYLREGARYYFIDKVDTTITTISAEVSNDLLKTADKTICSLIANNLLLVPSKNRALSFQEIVFIDKVEKQQIKLYTARTYVDGLYRSYKSFFIQVPDEQVDVTMDDKRVASVKKLMENGKKEKITTKGVYALVHNGLPYIATSAGYYQLRKYEDDFYFFSKEKVFATLPDLLLASYFFGPFGGDIANQKTIYRIRIDHLNGKFIRVKNLYQIE